MVINKSFLLITQQGYTNALKWMRNNHKIKNLLENNSGMRQFPNGNILILFDDIHLISNLGDDLFECLKNNSLSQYHFVGILTGRDIVSYGFLHEKSLEYNPQFKIKDYENTVNFKPDRYYIIINLGKRDINKYSKYFENKKEMGKVVTLYGEK